MGGDRPEGLAAGEGRPASLWSMLGQALYIGAIGYGGPTTLDYLRRIFVEQRGWFTHGEFLEALALAQVLPGSTGVSAVSYFGYRRYGYLGALLLPSAFLAPSIAAILLLSWAYFTYGQLGFVQPLFVGLGALVVALLLNATLSLGRSVCTGSRTRIALGLVIAATTFVGQFVLGLDVVWLVASSGALGIVLFRFVRDAPAPGPEVAAGSGQPSPRTPPRRLGPVLALAALVAAALALPEPRTLFVAFFQVGLLAFGGGFASVALLQHVVVDQMHWLPFTQFRDGIALGQITPGPVLITATFVGFKVGGVIGSLAATLGIFLPPAILVAVLADLHALVKRLRVVQRMVGGFQCGFIGLVAAVTIRFGVTSLVNWQTWLVFALGFGYVWGLKKNPGWAIVGTVAFSLLFLGR